MRIAFIHPRFPSAEGTGATHSATQIVTGLAKAGHDLRVYCTRQPDEDVHLPDVELRHLTGNSTHPHTSTRLNKEVVARKEELSNFDIVHSYLPRLSPSIAKVGKNSAVGTVVTLNAYGGICAKNDLLYRDRKQCQSKSTLKCINCVSRSGFKNNENGYIYDTVSKLLSLRLINDGEKHLEYIDGFRAPSQHVRDNYTQFGFDAEKIDVIPHPVDEDFLIPHRSNFTEPYKLLYVGALEKHKGVEKLIPILSSLSEKDTEFRLTIVGTGGLENTLQKQAKEFGVTELVEFAGFVPNKQLPDVYATHDCFVYPGIWEEPLARVYLESLATGTPIVSSEYGDVETVIGEGGVTTNGTVEGFVEEIMGLSQDPRFTALSRGTQSTVNRYHLDKITPQIEQLYNQIS